MLAQIRINSITVDVRVRQSVWTSQDNSRQKTVYTALTSDGFVLAHEDTEGRAVRRGIAYLMGNGGLRYFGREILET